jgi:hypothetical protein
VPVIVNGWIVERIGTRVPVIVNGWIVERIGTRVPVIVSITRFDVNPQLLGSVP